MSLHTSDFIPGHVSAELNSYQPIRVPHDGEARDLEAAPWVGVGPTTSVRFRPGSAFRQKFLSTRGGQKEVRSVISLPAVQMTRKRDRNLLRIFARLRLPESTCHISRIYDLFGRSNKKNKSNFENKNFKKIIIH